MLSLLEAIVLKKSLFTAALLASVVSFDAQARDQIRIVGSSTVFPFTTAVAEQFGRQGKFKTPIVESTGTGGGMRLFCAGVGTEHPDLTNASRRITKAEFEACKRNGVSDVVEVQVGYDGIVIAQKAGGKNFSISRKDLYRALARQVPVDGKLVPNPYKTWKEVNAELPAERIEVLGPPPTSGTRDSFIELVFEHVCHDQPEIKAIEDKRVKDRTCKQVREDGAFVEAGENDNLIVQKLQASPGSLGIFGFSFYDQNRSRVMAHPVEGIAASLDTISKGAYSIARPLFVYGKKAHVGVVPGIKEFLEEYTQNKAMGAEGYLTEKGLVPNPADVTKAMRERVSTLTSLTM